MDTTRKLQIVNGEPDFQKRLGLLVQHGFVKEATQLIREMVRSHTAMFHYDWHEPEFCRPLQRVTEDRASVYVIVTSSNKLDYHPEQRKDGGQHIVFELGWERKVLGWTEDESLELVRTILIQALLRPINQWSYKQAEGTGRASRRVMPAGDQLGRQIAAMHLIFQFREADFGHICGALVDIDGFPFAGGGTSKPLNEEGLVNWIAEQLQFALDWSPDRIRKEFVEWMWLKTGTWPQWLLAVAKAKIFATDDKSRIAAVRHWVGVRFDYLLNTIAGREGKGEMTEAFRQLFQIGQFGADDKNWICDKLVTQMASGKVSSVRWFFEQFGSHFGFNESYRQVPDHVLDRAIEVAAKEGRYGIAVALSDWGNRVAGVSDQSWIEIVQIRGLSTKLE